MKTDTISLLWNVKHRKQIIVFMYSRLELGEGKQSHRNDVASWVDSCCTITLTSSSFYRDQIPVLLLSPFLLTIIQSLRDSLVGVEWNEVTGEKRLPLNNNSNNYKNAIMFMVWRGDRVQRTKTSLHSSRDARVVPSVHPVAVTQAAIVSSTQIVPGHGVRNLSSGRSHLSEAATPSNRLNTDKKVPSLRWDSDGWKYTATDLNNTNNSPNKINLLSLTL